MSNQSDEIAREQQYMDMLYGRLDNLRGRATDELGRVRLAAEGTAQNRVERDVTSRELGGRLAQLDAAEDGLCFGRLDLESGERRYIGRIGMMDETAAYADNWSDRALLERVGRAVVVHPRGKLARLARQHGWAIVRPRRPPRRVARRRKSELSG